MNTWIARGIGACEIDKKIMVHYLEVSKIAFGHVDCRARLLFWLGFKGLTARQG